MSFSSVIIIGCFAAGWRVTRQPVAPLHSPSIFSNSSSSTSSTLALSPSPRGRRDGSCFSCRRFRKKLWNETFRTALQLVNVYGERPARKSEFEAFQLLAAGSHFEEEEEKQKGAGDELPRGSLTLTVKKGRNDREILLWWNPIDLPVEPTDGRRPPPRGSGSPLWTQTPRSSLRDRRTEFSPDGTQRGSTRSAGLTGQLAEGEPLPGHQRRRVRVLCRRADVHMFKGVKTSASVEDNRD